jgi:hypothetical protein
VLCSKKRATYNDEIRTVEMILIGLQCVNESEYEDEDEKGKNDFGEVTSTEI